MANEDIVFPYERIIDPSDQTFNGHLFGTSFIDPLIMVAVDGTGYSLKTSCIIEFAEFMEFSRRIPIIVRPEFGRIHPLIPEEFYYTNRYIHRMEVSQPGKYVIGTPCEIANKNYRKSESFLPKHNISIRNLIEKQSEIKLGHILYDHFDIKEIVLKLLIEDHYNGPIIEIIERSPLDAICVSSAFNNMYTDWGIEIGSMPSYDEYVRIARETLKDFHSFAVFMSSNKKVIERREMATGRTTEGIFTSPLLWPYLLTSYNKMILELESQILSGNSHQSLLVVNGDLDWEHNMNLFKKHLLSIIDKFNEVNKLRSSNH